MDIDYLRKLNHEEGAKLLEPTGYVKDCGITAAAAWVSENTRDEYWILRDENGATVDMVAWVEYFNPFKSPPWSDDDLILARWERVNWRIKRKEQ